MAKTRTQLAAYMLLSRPLPSTRDAPGLLPLVWSPICSRLAPIMGSVMVFIGMPITFIETPVAAKVRVVMSHGMVSRKLWCCGNAATVEKKKTAEREQEPWNERSSCAKINR